MARFLMLLLFLSPITFYAQSIEAINSNEEALAFLKKIKHVYEETMPDAELKHIRDSAFPILKRLNYYEKADFDNNGHTDLLFNGCSGCRYRYEYDITLPLVILSFGNDSFQVKDISCRKYRHYLAAKTIQSGGQPMIEIAYAGYEGTLNSWPRSIEGVDTLVYTAGEFIENTQPAHHTIENISFTHLGFGFDPYDSSSFTLTFSHDTTWLTRQIRTCGNTVIKKYVARTDTACWNRLTGLLNRMNFPGFKEFYDTGAYHESFGYLTINYDNGKVCRLRDIGLLGTYGLAAIYYIFFKTELSFAGILVSNESGMLAPPDPW